MVIPIASSLGAQRHPQVEEAHRFPLRRGEEAFS
jgi:hypothetical protein